MDASYLPNWNNTFLGKIKHLFDNGEFVFQHYISFTPPSDFNGHDPDILPIISPCNGGCLNMRYKRFRFSKFYYPFTLKKSRHPLYQYITSQEKILSSPFSCI